MSDSRDKPEFVYVIYIASTAGEGLQGADRSGDDRSILVRQCVDSDWKVGSPFDVRLARHEKLDITGKVLEFDPPRRLSYTFHPQYDGA